MKKGRRTPSGILESTGHAMVYDKSSDETFSQIEHCTGGDGV